MPFAPNPSQPITITASATLNRQDHMGAVINLSAAAGLTVTLPASTGRGDSYTIFVLTTVSSNNYVVQVANATDVIQGGVSLSTDISGTNMLCAATTDTITMNGSTTGGVRGGWLRLTDVSAGFWMLEGFLPTTGTEATPFSAAVS